MAENAAAAEEVAQPAPTGRRKSVLVFGIMAGVMIVEALVVFVLVKSFAGSASPAQAQAADQGGLVATEGQKAPARAEVKVGEFRAQNRKGQQSYMLQFSVFAAVAEPDKPKMDEAMASKAATIKDRFSRVVRSLDPERFVEPDLITLRTQLKEELAQVLGSEIKVEEVLLTDFASMVDG